MNRMIDAFGPLRIWGEHPGAQSFPLRGVLPLAFGMLLYWAGLFNGIFHLDLSETRLLPNHLGSNQFKLCSYYAPDNDCHLGIYWYICLVTPVTPHFQTRAPNVQCPGDQFDRREVWIWHRQQQRWPHAGQMGRPGGGRRPPEDGKQTWQQTGGWETYQGIQGDPRGSW